MQLNYLYILFLFILPNIMNGQQDTVKDTVKNQSANNQEELKSTRINFMYSYYEQDGIHSPVTGGIGDEELYDHGKKISVSVPIRNNINLSLLGGVDVYTSASTDNINNEYDLDVTETSASYKDERIYSSIGLEKQNTSGYIIGINTGFSKEWDVNSINAGLSLAYLSKNENTQIRLNTSYYKDKWDLIYPSELRLAVQINPSSGLLENIKHSFNVSLMFSQIINKRLKMALSIETIIQNGLLSTPFHRVYFNDATHNIERLPNKRFKIPFAIYSSYYMNDWSILRFYYRFYSDDFEINAHTIQIETPVKVSSLIVLSPFYRIHNQNASTYFEPFAMHNPNSEYYTSDYDLSAFTSQKIGVGIKYAPLFGFLNKMSSESNKAMIRFKQLEIRTAKYFRINNSGTILKAYIGTFGVSYTIN